MHSPEELLALINEALDKENLSREPKELYDPITYIMTLGGKRIRPVMMLMTVDMYDGDIRQAMPAALGLEIFHNFSLVHDDIMDRAPIRRGKPTVHEKWNANTAILSGDTMLVKAYEQFLKLPDHMIKPAIAIFSETATGVCEGQQMDMNFEERNDVTIQEYLDMIRLKTAVLIGASFRLGGMAAGASETDQRKLFEFGIHTGILFQLRDDLLDAYGDAMVFGKKQYGDIVTNKKTFLYLKTLERLSGKEKKKFSELYANSSMEQDVKIKKVMKYFNEAEVNIYTEYKIQEHYEMAVKAFRSLEVAEDRKIPINRYTEDLLGRKF